MLSLVYNESEFPSILFRPRTPLNDRPSHIIYSSRSGFSTGLSAKNSLMRPRMTATPPSREDSTFIGITGSCRDILTSIHPLTSSSSKETRMPS